MKFALFDSCVEPVHLEHVRCATYQLFGKTVHADHRADIHVIVPLDEGVIPHSAQTSTMAQKKGHSESIQDLFRFFQQRLGSGHVHWLGNGRLHDLG